MTDAKNKGACGASRSDAVLEALPCPFCGKPVDFDDTDTLYPSGVYWRQRGEFRTYHGHKDRIATDNRCWEMNCPTPAGGCGANVSGDSKTEALAKWNRRASNK